MSGGPSDGRLRTTRRGLPLVIAAFVLTAACGSAPRRDEVDSPSHPSIYFVCEARGWTLRQARNPAADDPVSSKVEPTLDWYAEYERYSAPNHSESVRVSGHDVSIAELEKTLAGFELRTRDAAKYEARVGSGPDGPRVVLLPVAGDYTVLTLSYELDLRELIQWSTSLRAVDEADWTAHGGVIAP